jgi:hypothetical protein
VVKALKARREDIGRGALLSIRMLPLKGSQDPS